MNKDSEAVARRCFVKKVFLEISQNSQENTCSRVSFLISCRLKAWNFIKKETLAQVFPTNFLIEHLRWVLLMIQWKKTKSTNKISR